MIKNVLVTGGLGFIGSETVVELIEKGYNPIIVDNLSNSKLAVLDRIKKIACVSPLFYKVDCTDLDSMRKIFAENKIDAVIHFAGFKSVAESVEKPDEYERNNVGSLKVVLGLMVEYHVDNLIFSSSATVYGNPERLPVTEEDPIGKPASPYGRTKIECELVCKEFCKQYKQLNIALLRYFNPIGAHPSGLLGEDPNGIPNNLMPYITKVAIGKLPFLHVYGSDYETDDGTAIRDYIHVVDLAKGHIAALNKLDQKSGLVIYNLGTGKGTSVLEIVNAFKNATGANLPYQIEGRRPGDVPVSYANCDKAWKELNWKTELSIQDACRDAYNFQIKNPNGID